MVVSVSFLDIELDLDFRPKALDVPLFIPGTHFELDAPGRPLAFLELTHHIC